MLETTSPVTTTAQPVLACIDSLQIDVGRLLAKSPSTHPLDWKVYMGSPSFRNKTSDILANSVNDIHFCKLKSVGCCDGDCVQREIDEVSLWAMSVRKGSD